MNRTKSKKNATSYPSLLTELYFYFSLSLYLSLSLSIYLSIYLSLSHCISALCHFSPYEDNSFRCRILTNVTSARLKTYTVNTSHNFHLLLSSTCSFFFTVFALFLSLATPSLPSVFLSQSLSSSLCLLLSLYRHPSSYPKFASFHFYIFSLSENVIYI